MAWSNRYQDLYLRFFFITITNRDTTKQTDQYLSQKIKNSMI